MIQRIIFIICLLFSFSLNIAQAEQCSAVFSDGIQNNNNSGQLTFNWRSRVTNSPDNILDSNNNINDGSGGVSCDSTTCSSSGNIALAVNYNDFPNNNNNVSVGFARTLSLSPGNYNNITLGSSATLNLSAGDYTLKGSLAAGYASRINISGKVRIFVNKTVKFNALASINSGGVATNLLIYAKKDVDVLFLSTITAFIYSKKDVDINFSSVVNGAVSGKNITLVNASTINFINTEPDFGDFCQSSVITAPTIVVNYRFDEASWSGSAGEVVDETTSYSATAINGANTENLTQAIVGNPGTCGYGVFDGINDYIALPNTFENQQGDFTITAWINPTNLQAGSRIFADDEKNTRGYAFSLGDPGSGKLRFYSRGVSPISVDTLSSVISTDTWTFVAAVHNRTTKTREIYVNGVAQKVTGGTTSNTYTGTWGVDTGIASIGGETNSGETNNRFTGKIDEVRFYKNALSASQIATIQNETHACATTSLSPVAEYRFEETTWDGSPDEILDNTGNGYHGKVLRDSILVNPAPATAPAAIAGDPGTCGYASQSSGSIQVTDLPLDTTTIGVKTTVTFWMNWNGINNVMPIGWYAHDIWMVSGSMGFNTGRGDIYGISSAGLANGWHHVAVEFTNGSVTNNRMHIDGVEQVLTQRRSSPNNRQAFVNSEFRVGGWSVTTGYDFQGLIDEVRLYQGALSTAQIYTIMNETHACAITTPHHFEIIHDGNGLTCEAEAITIKACANADCSTLYTTAVDVQLSINGTANKTITVLNGSTDTTFVYTQANTATLSLDETFECVNGGSSGCDVAFADTGFRFYSNSVGTNIPTQLSGKFSNIGFNASTLNLQAIQTNPETGACQAAFIDDVTIEMSATCVDPTACAINKKVVVNNLVSDTSINTLNNGSSLTYNNVDLDFGNNTQNSAEFNFYYPEAGQVQLHARYNIPDEDGNPTGNYMLGSSNTFVVRPFGFYVELPTNSTATTHLGTVFKKAGEDFTTTIKAVQWQYGDDTNNDGVPDSNANLSDNVITTNFGSETSSISANISHSLVLPSGGNLGTLTNSNFSGFSNGVASVSDMNYSEVGILDFTANLVGISYLGAGDITGSVANVGRFIPDHFDLSVDKEGSFVAVCDGISVDMPFAYSGQMSIDNPAKGVLTYLEKPAILITPKSKPIIPGGQGTHTLNYSGDFNKLLLSGVSRFMVDDGTGSMVLSPIKDASQLGVDATNTVRLTANYSDGSLAELLSSVTQVPAVLKFEYSAQDNFVYKHEENSEIIPFTSDINLSIASITDSDGVSAVDADGNGDTGTASDTVITLNPSGKEIRFGRTYLANSFGPETSKLPQTLQVQYLSSVNGLVFHYEPTIDDVCTAYNSANVNLTTLDPALNKNKININVVSGQFLSGETKNIELQVTPPSAGFQGKIGVEYDVYPWLEYYWNWSGTGSKTLNANPTAVATFGVFRGNDRIIYQREVTN